MARRSQKKRINDLLKPFSRELRDAFLAAIKDIRDNARFAEVIRALEEGNVNKAVSALHINRAAFTQADLLLTQIYQQGGATAVAMLPLLSTQDGTALVIRFDGRSERAEAWISKYVGDLVKGWSNDQVNLARNVLQNSLMAGNNPRSAVVDLIGRLDRATGERVGGFLGLTEHQASIIDNARKQLQEGKFADYLKRELRDKRFDGTIIRAIKEDKPLTSDQIDRMIREMKDNALQLRAETIGRTETMKALHAGQQEAYNQIADTGQVRPGQIRRIWRTAQDKDVRDSHSAMEGQDVGLHEPFITGNGVPLLYPGDPSGPPEEVIQCRCDVEMRIDFLADIK